MNSLQNKLTHALLAQTNLTANKADLVSGFTQGRTEKSSEMTEFEAREFIEYLKKQVPVKRTQQQISADKMRKRILSLAWEMAWIVYSTNEKPKVDVKRVNEWCLKYASLKKPFNDYLYNELPDLVTQFQNVYKSYLKGV